jgi:predicted ATPase/DNA-binding SARP family transcriptional activator
VPLDFRILGPFEVCGDDRRPLLLGGRKRRALLALLLLNRNTLVSSDRLLEQIWGSSSPDRALASLQVYVSHLRKLLGDGSESLQTREGGYSLVVSDDQVDASRFERLLRQGRQALVAGEPEQADRELDQALATWRGSPLADLAYESFAQAEIARLEELRLVAIELRIEAELRLGRQANLIGELEALVSENPLRESLRRHLMLALYRSGRQSDALAAYREARRTLLDELGLEPSPELKSLEAAILRQDAGLAVEPAELRARRHLPAPATDLIGRRAELGEISTLLRAEAPRLLTLTGPGGTGKTRLALQAAADVADRFDDGVFFAGLGPLPTSELVETTIAHALGVQATGDQPPLAALKEHVRDRRLLLLADNFEHVDDAAPVVSELLSAAPGLKVLVTSRTPLRLYGEHEYAVPPLAEDEAVELFARRAGAVQAGFTLDPSKPAVAELCRRLDHLPLAVELAAARSNELSLKAMLELLSTRLDLATRGPRDVPARQQTLRATIAWSVELLEARERELFSALAIFAGGWSLDVAQAVCSAELSDLASLVEKRLIVEREQSDGEVRFDMLETIREFAGERLRDSMDVDELRARHADYFLALAEEARSQLEGGGDLSLWLERLELEHGNLRAALAWLGEAGTRERELRLATALKTFWWLRGHLDEGLRTLEDALSRSEGEPPELRADALTARGVLFYRQGQFDAAKDAWEEALSLYRDIGNPTGIARSVGELGAVAAGKRDYVRAVELYEESAALFRETGDTMRLGSVLANLGAIANLQKDYHRGRPLLEEALALHRRARADDEVALALQNLGRLALQEQRYDDAAEQLRESLELSRDLQYRELIAYGLEAVAGLAAVPGRSDHAGQLLGSAEALFEELGIVLQADDRENYEQTVHRLTADVGDDRLAALRSEGRALPPEQALELALATLERCLSSRLS